MGMAASQARYLALTARKTNTEYEGQQLNQERVVLANRTADLFNQMLTMSVPTCPDSNDYTKIQYSWSDGYNDAVVSDYYQLSTADEDYNYVVTSYHYEDVYTGSRKLMNDPKIQSTRFVDFIYSEILNKNKTLTVKSVSYDFEDHKYTLVDDKNISRELVPADDAGDVRLELDSIYNRTTKASAHDFTYDEVTENYIYAKQEGGSTINVSYVPVDTSDEGSDVVKLLKKTYKTEYDPNNKYYYDEVFGTFIIDEGIQEAQKDMGMPPEVTIRKEDDGTVYYTDGERYTTEKDIRSITQEDNKIVLKHAIEKTLFANFTYVGNCKLSELTKEGYADKDVQTELRQIINDMNDEEKGDKTSAANLAACFDPTTGEYIGGIYSFTLHNVKYYTTLKDLQASAKSAFEGDNQKVIADNNIDPQTTKLAYYKANYLNTKVDETKKALLETDGKGRFTSVRFEDDSTVYTLNTETITDEEAYQNAMNQYYYNQEKYDKAIRDINAKTELIQAQDRTLELRMKQLDTEQNALTTEMEAVKKVISKNVEMTFKTFSGS